MPVHAPTAVGRFGKQNPRALRQRRLAGGGRDDVGQFLDHTELVVRSTFRSWVKLLAEQLEAVGVPLDRAAPIALATLAGMEGALILCRAEGNAKPLDTVADELMRLLPPETSRPGRSRTRRG